MPWFRVLLSLTVVAVLACDGRKRYWRGSSSCSCTQVDGGWASTSYQVVDVCAADEPDCVPSQDKCAQLLANAGCNTLPTAAACVFDPDSDYCDPYAPASASGLLDYVEALQLHFAGQNAAASLVDDDVH